MRRRALRPPAPVPEADDSSRVRRAEARGAAAPAPPPSASSEAPFQHRRGGLLIGAAGDGLRIGVPAARVEPGPLQPLARPEAAACRRRSAPRNRLIRPPNIRLCRPARQSTRSLAAAAGSAPPKRAAVGAGHVLPSPVAGGCRPPPGAARDGRTCRLIHSVCAGCEGIGVLALLQPLRRTPAHLSSVKLCPAGG